MRWAGAETITALSSTKEPRAWIRKIPQNLGDRASLCVPKIGEIWLVFFNSVLGFSGRRTTYLSIAPTRSEAASMKSLQRIEND